VWVVSRMVGLITRPGLTELQVGWIFTRNPELVDLVQDLFADQRIDVTVRYVPYVR